MRWSSIVKRIITFSLCFFIIFTNVNFAYLNKVMAGEIDQIIEIKFIDYTEENWISNNQAIIELVDNTNYHKKYIMTKTDDRTWTVRVPQSAYNLTFN